MATVFAGCLEVTAIECADGTLCPAGTVCRDDGTCADADAVAACDGLGQGDVCPRPSLGVLGVCADGLCVVAGCGNGVLELDERCDDGNQAARDGCSADCQSDETCGNTVVDPLQGEQCDDGGALSGDGCASGCLVEVPSWGVVVPPEFQPYAGPAAAYDPRLEAVLFVGNRVVWRYDGQGVTRLGAAPTLLGSAGLVFDAALGQMLLIGESTIGGVASVQTWALADVTAPITLESWHALDDGPPARTDFGLVWDSTRHRVILFGGTHGGAERGDTWAFADGAWTEVTPGTSPAPRHGHAMAYDPRRDRVVLIGGRDTPGNVTYADVWEFDGATWMPADATGAPSVAAAGAATFAGDLGAIVAISSVGVTASYDGAWSPLAALGRSVTQSDGPAMAYDPRRGAVVVLASAYNDPGIHDFAGGSWNSYYAWLFDSPHEETAAAYDSARALIVRFGGLFGDGDTTWNHLVGYDGTRWLELARRSPTRPSSRWGSSLAYDRQRADVVLFGGGDYYDGGAFDDTWVLHDDVWTEVPIVGGPSARLGAASVYDSVRGNVVMFGGAGESGGFDADVPLDDTWIFDGTDWTEVPGGAPPARRWPLLAFDERRGVTVLHGGEAGPLAGPTLLTDTWEFDGATWTPRLVASPPMRDRGAMAYDPMLGAVSLYGGRQGGGGADAHAHWLYDGTAWSEVAYEQGQPPDLHGHAMAFDAVRRRMIVLGGITQTGALELRLDAPAPEAVAPTETCDGARDADGDGLAGCDDPDCWGRCAPSCPPATTCAAPGCGDGVCDPTLELADLCVADCDACGDGVCVAGLETLVSCPTDCAVCGDDACVAGETAASCPGDC